MNREIEDIIKKVTQTVLAEIGGHSQQKTTLIFARRQEGLPDVLKEKIHGDDRLLYYSDQYNFEEVDRFILPCLHIDPMVDLAMGKGGSKLMCGVRQALLFGKEVEVAEFEYRRFLDKAPAKLTDMYKEYHDNLRKFGIVELCNTCQKGSETRFIGKGVITERDVETARRGAVSCLDVADNCCVTPLAYDYAREHSIVIKRRAGDTQ